MPRIHIHIGLNKTGTSSLQDFLSMNADALHERHGLLYPRTGREKTAHHPLSAWLRKAAGDQPAAEDLGQALLAEVRNAQQVVISSEDFHTHGARGIAHLAQLLRGHDVRIVLYVREHVAYLTSWYQQNVQATHLSCALDTFCFLQRKPLHKIADAWAEHFGRDKVTLRLYDRAALKGGDIVQDFAELVGLPADLSAFQRKPHESNPSVSGNLLFAKRVVNNFLTKPQATAHVDELTALSLLKPSFRGTMAVDAATVAMVVNQYKGDRLALRKQWGIDMPAREGAMPGHATPDLETLPADWALITAEAARRGFKLAEAGKWIELKG